MDPQQQFKERYNQYIAQQQAQKPAQTQQPPNTPAPGSKVSKKVIVTLGILLLAFGGGVFYALNQEKPTSQVADTGTQEQGITVTEDEINQELQNAWGDYFLQVKYNPEYREAARQEILIKKGAEKLGINVSTVASSDTSAVSLSEEVQKQLVTSRTLNTASVYRISGPNYDEVKQQIIDSLGKIREEVASGKTMQEAYDSLKNTQGFYKPITIQENVYVTKKSGWSPEFLNAVFNLHTGEVSEVIDSGTGAFLLAQVTDEKNTSFDSINDWIKSLTR